MKKQNSVNHIDFFSATEFASSRDSVRKNNDQLKSNILTQEQKKLLKNLEALN
jgi:hypothetical protein